ncbi:MAG: hypothetical protein VX514_05610 [Candidatus Thermoplasmatota archaeon]|nr:hypothetical protein [Candidatus Thermoplasmatota archaeon]
MSEDNIFLDLGADKRALKHISIFFSVLVVVLLYHATVFFVIMGDEISVKDKEKSFTISFQEIENEDIDTRTIDNGDREVIELEIEEDSLSGYDGFGVLFVDIEYGETSGQFADPCDSVSADISPNGVNADWDNENNVLAGTSSSCETISLIVYVFPEYNSTTKNVTGENLEYWESLWQNSSYGIGTFHLEVEVNVNQPPTAGIPTIQDDDEEVTISWRSIYFTSDVQEIE